MYEDKVGEALNEAIQELNSQLNPQQQISNHVDTILYGMDGRLDSIDLVTLIVIIEQKIEDKTGVKISLANEKALSMRNSPFRSVGSLQSYALSLVQELR